MENGRGVPTLTPSLLQISVSQLPGFFYSFPAFLRAFFFPLSATLMILFLWLLALRSLNLSKSFMLVRLALFSRRLAQEDWVHLSSTLLDSNSFLTTLVHALKGKLTLMGVRWICFRAYACLATPAVGPSMRTSFWSITFTIAAILPFSGPSAM